MNMVASITDKKTVSTELNSIQDAALMSIINGKMIINKSYISNLSSYQVELLTHFPEEIIEPNTDVRIFQVHRVVLENKQSILESLTAAYTALGSAGYSVFLLLKGDRNKTDVYLGVRCSAKNFSGQDAGKLLEQVFKGHFSGSNLSEKKRVDSFLYSLRHIENTRSPSITAVTGVPSLAVKTQEYFMQGLERFIDAVEGQTYQALILASPISPQKIEMIQRGYEEIATQLSPLLNLSLSFGENESESVGLSLGESISNSFGRSLSLTETIGTNESTTAMVAESESINHTNTTTYGKNTSKAYSTTDGVNFSQTETVTHGKSSSKTKSTTDSSSKSLSNTKTFGGGLGVGFAGFGLGLSLSKSKTTGSTKGHSETEGHTKGVSYSEAQSNMRGVSHSISESYTQGLSYSETQGHTKGISHSESRGKTFGSNNSIAKGKNTTETDTYGRTSNKTDTQTFGNSKQISLEILDKSIEQLIQKVDHQIERVNEARRYGGWYSAAYFISDTSASSRALASIFLGLMRGVNSNSEDFSLTTWRNEQSRQVLPWLANLSHPRIMADFSKQLGIDYLTPATLVSGKEMAMQLSLPRRSTSTVSVVEAQAFGRQIQNVNGTEEKAEKVVDLGHIRHLWQNLPQKVELDVQKLSSHIFVTGSTGSGKSNTIYQILSELNRNKVKFMVIEPAKGEYKNVFGHHNDVNVFGTNPKKTALLRINPFKFPEDVHVLEHIDRLVEIFNVCWPMYAAMPAVLKEAMLESYKASGWDLDNSYNRHPNLFPSFADLLTQLKKVIDKSAFSQEVRSNYEGSLITRVTSLTNGLNGQIFSSHEIDNKTLFDENVIVDLSRVGSQETKALIMGILVMRLNEYRMSESDGMNELLKHVTVLEEAHNILKRTSTEQSSEGSNVADKAVEMLSNAIAEMRTYGEGFIIADQSPSAVDISAIRNTNTKIVMRLPDEEDRRLAGKASGVTDEQLEEIAKLPKGVAIIYQNDWLEPVLCQVHEFKTEEKLFKLTEEEQVQKQNAKTEAQKQFHIDLAELLFSQKLLEEKKLDLKKIGETIEKSNLPIEFKAYFNDVITQLERGVIAQILEQNTDYLIDLYQRLVQQHLADIIPDLPEQLQQHLADIIPDLPEQLQQHLAEKQVM